MTEQEKTRILLGLLDAGDPGPVVRQIFRDRYISAGQVWYEQAYTAWGSGTAWLLGFRPRDTPQDQPWHRPTY